MLKQDWNGAEVPSYDEISVLSSWKVLPLGNNFFIREESLGWR